VIASKLLSSPERIRLVKLFLFETEVNLKVRETAGKAKVSPALVSGTIRLFKKKGLIKKNKIDFLHPVIKALKILLNIEFLESIKLTKKTLSLFDGCNGIGLYGSWADGTNTKESDIDLWIKTGKENEKGVAEIRKLFKGSKIEASIFVLTEKKLKELKEKDFVFYCVLHNSFVLFGEGL